MAADNKIADAYVEIEARMIKMEKGLDAVRKMNEKAAKRVESRWHKAGAAIAKRLKKSFKGAYDTITRWFKRGIFAGGAAAVAGIGFSVKQAGSYEQAMKQIETRIKSSGSAARITKDDIVGLSNAMQKYTPMSNTAFMELSSGLLSFHKIDRSVFPQVVMAIADTVEGMRALGKPMSLGEAGIRFGRAFNNPARGLETLTEAGVEFTDQQREQIKWLTRTGQVRKAQYMLLAEIDKEFGGSAHAATETLFGKLRMAGNVMADFGRGVGTPLTEALKEDLTKFIEHMSSPDAAATAEKIGEAVTKVYKQLSAFVSSEEGWTKMWKAAQTAAENIESAMKAVAAVGWVWKGPYAVGKAISTTAVDVVAAGVRQEYERELNSNLSKTNKYLQELSDNIARSIIHGVPMVLN